MTNTSKGALALKARGPARRRTLIQFGQDFSQFHAALCEWLSVEVNGQDGGTWPLLHTSS